MAVEGFEADDLIANAVALAQERGAAQVVIVSTDKDLCQLVTEPGLGDGQAARRARTAPPSRPAAPAAQPPQPPQPQPHLPPSCLARVTQVSVYNDRKKETWDAAMVEQKFGVRPSQLADYLALTGDKSDNVPGVMGVGPKKAAVPLRTSSAPPQRRLCAANCAASAPPLRPTAPPLRPLRAPLRAHPVRPLHPLQTFLQQHGTLEALLAAAPAMKKSKVRDALISYGDSALSQRSKAAVVLGLQSELESRADELVGAVPPPPAERPELREFLQRHEFASLERKHFGRAAR